MTVEQPEPQRAWWYARQSVRRDVGIAHQEKENLATIDRSGSVLVDGGGDNAVSGTRRRGLETEYRRMLAARDADLFDVLFVTRVDRLIRNADRDVADILDRKMKVVVGGTLLDLSVARDRDWFRTLASRAQFEVEEKTERALPVLTQARLDGHPKAGRVPYGYRWRPDSERKASKDQTRYVQVPAEAEVLQWASDAVLASERPNLKRLCVTMEEKGVRTHASAKYPQGVPFGPSTLRRALLSPFVAGLLPPSQEWGAFDAAKVNPDECRPGAWEPIIEPDRWRAMRARLLDASRTRNGGQTARKHLLGGLAQCSVCFMTVKSGVTRHGARAYRCRSEKHFTRLADPIDQYVEHMVVTRLLADDARELLHRPGARVDLNYLRAQRLDLQQRVEQLVRSMAAPGGFTYEQVLPHKKDLDEQIAVINAKITTAYAVDPLAAVIDAQDVEAAWQRLDLDQKRAVIASLMSIDVRPVGNGGRVRNLDDARRTIRLGWKYEQWREDDFEDGELPLVLLRDGSYVPAVFGKVRDQVAAAVV